MSLSSGLHGGLVSNADGSWIAYQTTTPARLPGERSKRFSDRGVPASALGQQVWIVRVVDHHHTAVGPPNAASWHPRWSPDGQYLAFYSDASGAPGLWVHDVEASTSRRVGDAEVKAHLWAGDEPIWSPDGSQLYVPLVPSSVATDRSPDGDAPSTLAEAAHGGIAVYKHAAGAQEAEGPNLEAHFLRENHACYATISLDDGKTALLAPSDADPPQSTAQLSPSGAWLTYLSVWRNEGEEQPHTLRTVHDLVLLSTDTGRQHVLARGLPAPDPTVTGYAWHPANDQVFWVEHGRLWMVDPSIGFESLPLSPAGLELTPSAPEFSDSSDGVHIIAQLPPTSSSEHAEQRLGIAASDVVEGGTWSWTELDLPPQYVLNRLIPGEKGYAWAPAGNAVVALATHVPSAETALLSIDLATGTVDVSWQGRARLEPVRGDTSETFLTVYEDLNTPADIYRMTRAGHLTERITDVNPDQRLPKHLLLTTIRTPLPHAAAGEQQSAVTQVISQPAKPGRDGPPPGVMLIYPGDSLSHFGAEFAGGAPSGFPILPLLQDGYTVLLAEVPLSAEGEPGQPLQDLASAIIPQLNHADGLGFIDRDRVAIVGHSFGAYATAAVISTTNAFKAAIAISGMYDLPGMYGWNDFNQLTSRFWYFETGQARMGNHPWADRKRYLDNSPYYQADQIHTPLLLLHGAADPYSPAAEAGKMFNALKRLDRPAELAVYQGEGHTPTEWAQHNLQDATTRTAAFLHAHLG